MGVSGILFVPIVSDCFPSIPSWIEWYLVQQLGSSWIYHVRPCVAAHAVLCGDCYESDRNGGNSSLLGYDLQHALRHGLGVPRKDKLNRSR